MSDERPASPDTSGYATLQAALLEDGTVLRILLDRPKGNVLNRAMMAEIMDALNAHRDQRRLKLVYLRGAGGNFSFGAAVEEHVRDMAEELLDEFHALVRAIAHYPVPMAALVEGRCLGGAFETVLACHFVFATSDARFGCPEIRLGVFPPVLAVAGASRLGGALAERLLLTGDEIDAALALQAGFLTAVFDATDPEAQLLEWHRRRLAPLSAFSLRVATRAAREGSGLLAALGDPLDMAQRLYLEELLESHDGNEGIAAFLARRAAEWKDA